MTNIMLSLCFSILHNPNKSIRVKYSWENGDSLDQDMELKGKRNEYKNINPIQTDIPQSLWKYRLDKRQTEQPQPKMRSM